MVGGGHSLVIMRPQNKSKKKNKKENKKLEFIFEFHKYLILSLSIP